MPALFYLSPRTRICHGFLSFNSPCFQSSLKCRRFKIWYIGDYSSRQRHRHQTQIRSFFYICCVWQALKGMARVVVMTFPFQITRKWWFIAYFSFKTAFSLRVRRTRLNWCFIMISHESSLQMKTCRQFCVVRGWMNGKWDVLSTIIITQRDNWKNVKSVLE